MGISIVGLVAARRANKQHRQKGHQYFTHGFNYKYVRMELERQHACAQHVLHGMNGHYNLFLCNLSALCTFACNALIFNVSMRADSPRFCLHRHLHYCERRCVTDGHGRAGKQQREGEKTVGATYFPTSRYSNSAILAHKRHNHVHLLRAVPAHDLQCRQSADIPTHCKCLITSDLEPISVVCRQYSK